MKMWLLKCFVKTILKYFIKHTYYNLQAKFINMAQENNKTINEILETVNSIKENIVTKDELKNEVTLAKQEIKDEINQNIDEKITKAKNEIIAKVDEFITLHQKF